MVSPQRLYEVLDHVIGFEKDLVGKRILVSAGPTREALDPVRFLTNHPSGSMDMLLPELRPARVGNKYT